MCAINGFNFPDRELIIKMNSLSAHRGPDDTRIYLDEEVSLGHNRLSIIDLSEKASQPMGNSDGSMVLVFNGEIYNYLEIKNELKELGVSFKSESDSEVILEAYGKWGKDSVKRFNGIFAFAIWDKIKKELFLARDRFGVKPLYYFYDQNKFVFSSEIKSILEHPIPRNLDIDAFNLYMRVLYVPEPLTMFRNIRKLPPAHTLSLRGGGIQIDSFVSSITGDTKNMNLSYDDAKEQVREVITSAVRRQLISDRPLGIYLSGGIDSSVVLDRVSSLRGSIDTFSVGFELENDEEKDKFNRDFNLARETARYYGTNHNEVVVNSDNLPELFQKAVWHLDEPISNPTVISMLELSSFTKHSVDVVLGGDGGDELFGGYERYRLSLIASHYQKLPGKLRNLLSSIPRMQKLDTPAGVERFSLFMFQKSGVLEKVISGKYLNDSPAGFFQERFFNDPSNNLTIEEKLMKVDRQSWLVDESLTKTDKMAMANGLEARVPFLDNEVVALAESLPLEYKVDLFSTKKILKDAFRGIIPDSLFKEPKRGWFSPGAKWLRRPTFTSYVKEVLSPGYCLATSDMFEWKAVNEILDGHLNRSKYNLTILWAILTFQVWAREYGISIDQ